MPTSILGSPEVADTVITQILTVAAVLTAFPLTTLSGALPNRFKTALNLVNVTPANSHIKDENGDVLCLNFLTAAPNIRYFTQRGLKRLELETSASQGY